MGLNIVICIKSVVMDAPDGQVVRSPETCELNPFDRPALEMALQLREAHGGKITALSMGPEISAFALLEAMALGIDRGILISDPALAGSDTLATSNALAAAIGKLAPFDIALFGTRTYDSDTGQVGPQTAVLLNLPMVTWVYSVEKEESGFIVERKADGYRELYRLILPAVLTVHPSSVQPRHVGLYGIESAFEKRNVETWALKDLGLSPDQVGEEGSPTRVLSLRRIKKDRKCQFISGSAEEQAEALTQRLLDSGLIG